MGLKHNRNMASRDSVEKVFQKIRSGSNRFCFEKMTFLVLFLSNSIRRLNVLFPRTNRHFLKLHLVCLKCHASEEAQW